MAWDSVLINMQLIGFSLIKLTGSTVLHSGGALGAAQDRVDTGKGWFRGSSWVQIKTHFCFHNESVWQEQGQLQWPHRVSLEQIPGTVWGPGAGAFPVTLRALTVRAAPWSGGNFSEKVKSSGFFFPPEEGVFPTSHHSERNIFPLTFSMRRPLLSCLSREDSRAMLGSTAPASAMTGGQVGLSDTIVALLGATRLCPFRCSQQGNARGETTLIQRDRQRLQDQMGDEVSRPLPSHHPWDLGILSPQVQCTVIPYLHS